MPRKETTRMHACGVGAWPAASQSRFPRMVGFLRGACYLPFWFKHLAFGEGLTTSHHWHVTPWHNCFWGSKAEDTTTLRAAFTRLQSCLPGARWVCSAVFAHALIAVRLRSWSTGEAGTARLYGKVSTTEWQPFFNNETHAKRK